MRKNFHNLYKGSFAGKDFATLNADGRTLFVMTGFHDGKVLAADSEITIVLLF
jgi:hypothetical protein